ncbi:MAG: hypothetical protein ACLSH1_07645 [Clostridia bacterium]
MSICWWMTCSSDPIWQSEAAAIPSSRFGYAPDEDVAVISGALTTVCGI